MLRCIGAIMVVGAAGGFGLTKALQYAKQVRLLKDFIAAVEILNCELNYTMLPLSKLFQTTSERLSGSCSHFFAALSSQIECGTPRMRAAQTAMNETRGLTLPNDATMAILELCGGLGRYDMDGENRMLRLTGQRLKSALERTESEKKPLAKSYASLGFCSGIALIILML